MNLRNELPHACPNDSSVFETLGPWTSYLWRWQDEVPMVPVAAVVSPAGTLPLLRMCRYPSDFLHKALVSALMVALNIMTSQQQCWIARDRNVAKHHPTVQLPPGASD